MADSAKIIGSTYSPVSYRHFMRRNDFLFLAGHFIQSPGRKYNWPHLGLAPDALK